MESVGMILGLEGESKVFKYFSSVATQNYKAISGDDSIGRREIGQQHEIIKR